MSVSASQVINSFCVLRSLLCFSLIYLVSEGVEPATYISQATSTLILLTSNP